jgi:hypothetical protein
VWARDEAYEPKTPGALRRSPGAEGAGSAPAWPGSRTRRGSGTHPRSAGTGGEPATVRAAAGRLVSAESAIPGAAVAADTRAGGEGDAVAASSGSSEAEPPPTASATGSGCAPAPSERAGAGCSPAEVAGSTRPAAAPSAAEGAAGSVAGAEPAGASTADAGAGTGASWAGGASGAAGGAAGARGEGTFLTGRSDSGST